MRAATFSRPGPAQDVIEIIEVAMPEPGPGQVRVRVHASGVNPTDVKSRTYLFPRVAHMVPVIPHLDGAGVIDKLGDGVSATRLGERVWLAIAQWRGSGGTCAEYVVIPENYAFPLADNMSFVEGACLGGPALTAVKAINLAGELAGKTVLVTAGASACGHYAIQMARAAGATVIATISGDAKAELARAAGAAHTVNYKQENLAERIMALTDGRGVDHMTDMDMSSHLPLYPQLVAIGGSIALYGSNELAADGVPTQDFFVRQLRLTGIFILLESDESIGAMAATVNALCQRGELIHNVAATFPFARTAEAHNAVEQGGIAGNMIVEID
jgi:NADPH2:quinone reductase